MAGDGLDAFYQRVTQRLPGYYVLVGVHDARGFDSAHGGQMENWLDYGNGDFNPNPEVPEALETVRVLSVQHEQSSRGPALVMNLTKTPTREYPAGTRRIPMPRSGSGLTMACWRTATSARIP